MHQATNELLSPATDDLPAQVAIELVVHAWPHLASIDPTWDLMAVDLLSIRDTLYLDRAPIVTGVEPATRDSRTVRDVVRRLLALAELATSASSIQHPTPAVCRRRHPCPTSREELT